MIYTIVISLYILALLWITVFALGQLGLSRYYLKAQKNEPKSIAKLTVLPSVTVQLPMYNERYVIDRLLVAAIHLDYPADKLTIQILDDSTDETSQIIKAKIAALKKTGITIQHIQRTDRVGFKAGALAYGLTKTNDEYIAIFDADFIPNSDFLKSTLPYFSHDKIGMVQTRWTHLNEDFSLLTRMQAFGLNAHFSVDQAGRSAAGSFINFNGTGGIWRKTCIQSAGGWQHDTLTEDLDLSYRAQLAGWQFEYIESIECPAELPIMIPAIKSQQYRWNKGAAESARKHLPAIFKSGLAPIHKLRAALHLLNSSVFLFLLIAAALSIPMLYIKSVRADLGVFFDLGTIFVVGFVAIGIYYWVSTLKTHRDETRLWYYLKNFPLFMVFSMGLALHNSIAIVEGLIGKKTPFIRTPKFNVIAKGDTWVDNKYLGQIHSTPISTWMEGVLSLYFLFGVGYGILIGDYGLLIWHSMLALGFGAVCLLSIRSSQYASA